MHNYNILAENYHRELSLLRTETTESIETIISGFLPEVLKEWPDACAVSFTKTAFQIYNKNKELIPCHGAKKEEKPFTHEINKFRDLIKKENLDVHSIEHGDFNFIK